MELSPAPQVERDVARVRETAGKSKFGTQDPVDLPDAVSLRGSKEVELGAEPSSLIGTIERNLEAFNEELFNQIDFDNHLQT